MNLYNQLAGTGLRFICSQCLLKQTASRLQYARYKLSYVPKRQYWTSRVRYAKEKVLPDTQSASKGKKSLPKFPEVKRLIRLAKPEKWKITGILISSSC